MRRRDNLLRLSLRSYGRHLCATVGVPGAGLLGLGTVVVVLCLSATGLAVGAVLSLDLAALGASQVGLLREDFFRGLVFLSVCAGIFIAVTSAPGTAFRLLLRTTGGSRWDRYLLVAAPRDLLCLLVPPVLGAVAYVPLATLVREQVGLVSALALGLVETVAVCVLTVGLIECLRTVLKLLGPRTSDGLATAASCVLVAAAGLWMAPLSLLPWDPATEWRAFGGDGALDGVHVLGHALLLLLAVIGWGAAFLLGRTSDRVTSVLQPPSSLGLSWIPLGRARAATLVSFFVATTLRIPVVALLILMSWSCAVLALSASSDLTKSIALVAGAGLAGSVGLRAHGAELASRWWILRLAPSFRMVAWTLPVSTVGVSLTSAFPVLASAVVLFEPRAAGYFLVVTLTTVAFTLFAGTLVPVSGEDPLSTVTAGAVSFALSGGVVGLIESGLAERSEAAAALAASLVAMVALVLSATVAGRRYHRSVLP